MSSVSVPYLKFMHLGHIKTYIFHPRKHFTSPVFKIFLPVLGSDKILYLHLFKLPLPKNEIAPRDFIFREREFEQMEIEYFVRAEDWEKYFEYWRSEMLSWMEDIGLDMTKVHELEVGDGDRAHYSKRTIDFEFDFPFGRKELYGLAYRTDFDLKNHKLDHIDAEKSEKIIPHVIEPSMGVDRSVLALLLSAYTEEVKDGETRPYLKLKPNIAPVICAVSPLLKNKPELVEYANTKVYAPLKAEFGRVAWDDNGNIGKRYRRQDEIGTPFCIVVDFDTLSDNTVTVRDRDTGEQERMKVEDLKNYIKKKKKKNLKKKKKKKKNHEGGGFTLIELLVVVSIISLLASIVFTS